MNVLCERFGIEAKEASAEFWDVVIKYPWPGNVREMIQALEKALLQAKDEPMLFPKHLPVYIRIQVARGSFVKGPAGPAAAEKDARSSLQPPRWQEIRKAAVSAAEQKYVKDLMSSVGGKVDEACRISGLSRSRLYSLLRKYRSADWRHPT